jgi:hypothetical protein
MITDEEAARIQDEQAERSRREQEEYVKSGRQADARRESHDTIAWWKANHYSGWA